MRVHPPQIDNMPAKLLQKCGALPWLVHSLVSPPQNANLKGSGSGRRIQWQSYDPDMQCQLRAVSGTIRGEKSRVGGELQCGEVCSTLYPQSWKNLLQKTLDPAAFEDLLTDLPAQRRRQMNKPEYNILDSILQPTNHKLSVPRGSSIILQT